MSLQQRLLAFTVVIFPGDTAAVAAVLPKMKMGACLIDGRRDGSLLLVDQRDLLRQGMTLSLQHQLCCCDVLPKTDACSAMHLSLFRDEWWFKRDPHMSRKVVAVRVVPILTS